MATQIAYVDPGVAGGLGNGSSWANAYSSARTAMIAYIGIDLSGDDIVFLCRTFDGTKDTGQGAIITGYVNFGTIIWRGANQAGDAGPLIQSAIDATRYSMQVNNGNEGMDARQIVTVEYIQFEATGATTGELVDLNVAHGAIIRGCILDRNGTTNTGAISALLLSGADNCLIYNNFIYDNKGIGSHGIYNNNSDRTLIANNTIVANPTDNFFITGATVDVVIKNNVSQDAGSEDYDIDPVGFTSAKNVSSDTSSPDVAFRSITLAFESKGTKDFRLAVGDTEAIDAGEDLSGIFTVDFFGTTRSGWSIGAHEPPAADDFDEIGSGTITLSGASVPDITLNEAGDGTITLSGVSVPDITSNETGSGTIALSGTSEFFYVSYDESISEIFKDIYMGESYNSLQEELVPPDPEVSYYDLFLQGGS